jgi:hypothetical protein
LRSWIRGRGVTDRECLNLSFSTRIPLCWRYDAAGEQLAIMLGVMGAHLYNTQPSLFDIWPRTLRSLLRLKRG